MSNLHVGVIGLGAIGRTHVKVIRALEQGVTVSAVDPGPGAQSVAESLGVPLYRDLETMHCARKLDAVVVAVPTDRHLEVSSECVALGLPLLVEKPIAATVADARLLTRRAAEKGVPLLVGHHRRYNPVVQAAARLVAQGEIGRPVAVW